MTQQYNWQPHDLWRCHSLATVSNLPTYGDGVSSTIFWCRLCIEHSLSTKVTTLPSPSPKIWTSMCRALCTYFSMNTPASPKLALPCLKQTTYASVGITAAARDLDEAQGLVFTSSHASVPINARTTGHLCMPDAHTPRQFWPSGCLRL